MANIIGHYNIGHHYLTSVVCTVIGTAIGLQVR